MNDSSGPNNELPTLRNRWRFGFVLMASLLLAVAQPMMSGLIDEEGSFDVFFSLLIVAVLLLVFEEKEHRRIGFSLGLAAFLTIWVGHGFDGAARRVFLVGAYLLATGFFAFALYGILRAILAFQVTGDAIFGAICGYLLLGIIWSLLYFAVELAAPGSFNLPTARADGPMVGRSLRGELSYFSFITLATVGYGDVTPRIPLARGLSHDAI